MQMSPSLYRTVYIEACLIFTANSVTFLILFSATFYASLFLQTYWPWAPPVCTVINLKDFKLNPIYTNGSQGAGVKNHKHSAVL